MKRFLVVMWLVTSVAGYAGTNAVPTMDEQNRLFMEAVLLVSKGLYAEAEPRLKQLADLQPNQPTIRQMLEDVREKLKKQENEPARLLNRKLDTIVLPEVKYREASAADIIEALPGECERLDPEKTGINFVWQVSADAKLSPVTLSLRKVPVRDLLNYVTRLAGLRYRVDSHAVVIYQLEAPHAKPE